MDDAVRAQLDRIERKLDVLIEALAEDEETAPALDLDGGEIPRERNAYESLG